MLDVPIQISGQRSARVARAELEIQAARARVAAGASSITAEAGAAYVALLAAQQTVEQLTAADKELRRLREIVAGREVAGTASRYDLTRLDIEQGVFFARLEEAKADVFDRAGNLAALLGLHNWLPMATGELKPFDMNGAELLAVRGRASSSPAAVAAALGEKVAQGVVEVARRDRVPTPSLSIGRSWTSDPFGAANFLGLSIEIPIFDTRAGPLARAQADAQTARLQKDLAQAEAGANIDRLANIIAARQTALQRFELEAGARLPMLKQMSEDAYRLGRSSILELLDATRSHYEFQRTRVDLVAALLDAQIRLLALNGDLEKAVGEAPSVQ